MYSIRIWLACCVILWQTGLFAQHPILKMNSHACIPDIIQDGQAYNLSGYVLNVGQGPAPSTLDIYVQVNGGGLISILNNYNLVSNIAPGDSAYWSVSGFVFPNSAFSSGNNDILIWPTSPSGGQTSNVLSDTLVKSIFFADQASFRTNNDHVEGMILNVDDWNLPHNLYLSSENVGPSANVAPVDFFMSLNGGTPKYLGSNMSTVLPGNQTHLSLPNFRFDQFFSPLVLNPSVNATIQIWAREFMGLEPAGVATFEVLSPLQNDLGHSPLHSVYPMPIEDQLHWISDSPPSRIVVVDGLGRTVLEQTEAIGSELDMQGISKGVYHVQFTFPHGVFTRTILKQ